MNISYRWLRALLPELDDTPEETAERLALRGAPVEEITPLAPGLEGLVVGRVEGVEAHPKADHLSVCRVDLGGREEMVVCGAPNVEVGGLYPFAPVGSTLPGGAAIESVKLRGVDSDGMLCSEAELELGPDASGLLALPPGLTPGQDLVRALGMDDWRMDVEVTANRGDLLSHAGVARELASEGAQGVILPPIPGIPGAAGSPWPESDGEVPCTRLDEGAPADASHEVSAGGATVRIQDPDLCSRYLGAVIRGVKVGPSPEWLASRLRAAGSRPINNVVDATNYVLLELGQPLHAFDLHKLGKQTIVVRRSRAGEKIRTLDGEDRVLEEGMLAICDAEIPVAIAGVMGGADSEVSETTSDILLECALFDPKSIRATRNALGMSTDASYRFERGVDPAGMELAVRRAVEIILATAGGTPDETVLDARPRPWEGLRVSLRPSRVKTLLGITLTPDEIGGLLEPLGFRVMGVTESAMDVEVPGFRSYDVRREVDLLEEVARTYGYDRFPADLRAFRPGTVPDHPLFGLEDDLRTLMVGEGFLEAQTQAFAPEGEGEVRVSNPVSTQEGYLRTRLLPGLLRRAEYNFARGLRDIRLFEIGTVFLEEGKEAPREETHLALVMSGAKAPLHWQDDPGDVDLWTVKGLMERLAPACSEGVRRVEPGAAEGEGVIQTAGFQMKLPDGRTVGFGGKVDPKRIDAPAWAGAVWALEVVLPSDPEVRKAPVFEPLPAFPAVDRDLALLIPLDLPARDVEELIWKSSGPLLVDLVVFDLYEGEGIPDGHRSVAFRLKFQSEERTLTDEDVERIVKSVTDRLREEFGVEPRG